MNGNVELEQASKRREESLNALLRGARLKGIDELLQHLDSVTEGFKQDPRFSKIAFLLERSIAGFETAIEATLSGYLAVAIDAMRDIMEIENLLLDFALSPTQLDLWLDASPSILRRTFSPRAVRERLHAAGEGRYKTSSESMGYRAHSAALHVTPHRHPIANKGFSAQQGWGNDAGFWEIFQHSRRLRIAIKRLTTVLAPASQLDDIVSVELPAVTDAWKRTQEMQAIYFALMQATAETQEEEDESAQ